MKKISNDFLGGDFYKTLNDIIDWVNGVIGGKRIVKLRVTETHIIATYLDGSEKLIPLQSTRYYTATEGRNGLMSTVHVLLLGKLELLTSNVEKMVNSKNEASKPSTPDDGAGDGDGASNGDNGGMGGGEL